MSVLFSVFGCASLFPTPPGYTDIAVPKQDLPAGYIIHQSDLAQVRLPNDYIPRGALLDPQSIVGRTVNESLLHNEYIRAERLSGPPPPPVSLVPVDPPLPDEESVFAIVTSHDMAVGSAITANDLYAVQILPQYLPEGVFLSPEHVVGRLVCERILQNELVRAERLDDEGRCDP